MSKKLIRANNAYACSDCIALAWLTRLGEPKWGETLAQPGGWPSRASHPSHRANFWFSCSLRSMANKLKTVPYLSFIKGYSDIFFAFFGFPHTFIKTLSISPILKIEPTTCCLSALYHLSLRYCCLKKIFRDLFLFHVDFKKPIKVFFFFLYAQAWIHRDN